MKRIAYHVAKATWDLAMFFWVAFCFVAPFILDDMTGPIAWAMWAAIIATLIGCVAHQNMQDDATARKDGQ